VFISFINGTIKKLPWCEENEIEGEISIIKDLLIKLNSLNIFTINSQPNVNGVPSNDPVVGWGPSDGYIYQKFYLEFFIKEEHLNKLIDIINKQGGKSIAYQAANNDGGINWNVKVLDIKNNFETAFVNALTWGVFPNREIIQPTIYDSNVVNIWKEEAFGLWDQWIKIYDDTKEGSSDLDSAKILKNVTNIYFTVKIDTKRLLSNDSCW